MEIKEIKLGLNYSGAEKIFIAVLLVVLTSSLTWVAKDLMIPCPVCPACPDVTCPLGIKIEADVNGQRGDLILEDCHVNFFKRAGMPTKPEPEGKTTEVEAEPEDADTTGDDGGY